MNRGKEQKTPDEKEAILKEAVAFFTGLVRKGAQGNVTFPLYDGIVGKAKLELFVEPAEAKSIFRIGTE